MRQAYADLNLERNPFGALTREQRARIAVFDVDERIEQMRSGKAVVFVGGHGRGKSIRLQALARRFEGAEYRRVHRDEAWPNPEGRGPLLVDEIQFLDRKRRRRLWRVTRPVAVASHEAWEEEMAVEGRESVTVDLDQPLELEDLAAFLRRRIELCRRRPGPIPTLSGEALRRLRENYGSNHRGMQDHLYEVFHRLERPRTVEVEDLASVAPPEPEVERAGSARRPDG